MSQLSPSVGLFLQGVLINLSSNFALRVVLRVLSSIKAASKR
tara:strand:- start:2129 stop:2254 length:126 start_codon:yes stop_codon:yes gene_type:complete